MSKPRVLHIVNSLDPGGMENGVVNIIGALQGDFEFSVACVQRSGKFSERLPDPVQVCVLGKRAGFSPRTILRLRAELCRYQPDLIHTHNLGPLIYAALATWGGSSVPILHGEHSQLAPEECTPRRLFQRRLFYRFCRQIHTVSHSQREELIAKGFSGIRCVLNGVNAERFCPGLGKEVRVKFCIPEQAVVMGVVGRFGPFKGHASLIEAFSSLAAEFPELHLLIVGAGGPEEPHVRAVAQNSEARARIHFAGFQAEPALYYRAMDFLVVPSVNEGLSNAVLEAMACATPVLANTACGNAEVMTSGQDGIISDLGTPNAIRNGVLSVLKQKERLVLWGKNSRMKVVQNFSLDRMVKTYAALYHSIAQN